MKVVCRTSFFCAAVLASANLWAARHIGFETDAFNRVYPASFAKSIVFSPASFEIDCAVIAGTLETIPKANVSETMGVVLDFESTYRPILEAYAARTNGFEVVSARAFCLPELKQALPAFRQNLQRMYGVEAVRTFPTVGAESWFRATMEGAMEDFRLPVDLARTEKFAYYDLVSVTVAWRDPFPTENTRKLKFRPAPDAEPQSVVCMSDVRRADTWETKEYTLLRLPLKDEAWFYALLPKEGFGLAEARADISSVEIDHLLSVMMSDADLHVAHGPCAIVLPRLSLCSRLDFTAALTYFRIPSRGLRHVAGDLAAREFVQVAKFSLAEQGVGETPLAHKDADAVVPLTPDVKKLVFNRPFLFFVYHERTKTIPIAGQYCGEE